MAKERSFFTSSVGKKYIMGFTGLIWVGFVFTHMLGNLLIFCGPEAYNSYGHALITNPAIYAAEAVLVVSLLLHITMAICLTLDNKKARGSQYYMGTNGEKGVSLASKTMIQTGLVIFAFTVYHLITFKYGPVYMINHDGVEMRDLHRLIIEVFQDPKYVVGYVVCMVALGIHLSHGFASMFKSWGFNHPKYEPLIQKASCAYSFVVAAGFSAQPIYAMMQG